jgi:membrane fusion protein, multidrug efflux system
MILGSFTNFPETIFTIMKKIYLPVYLPILLTVFLFACSSKTSPKNQAVKKAGTPSVEGFVVKPTTLTQTISVSGTVKPFEETVLMPEAAGRVVKFFLPEGKSVRQGTLLVKLFDDDLQAGLKKAMAQLQLAELTEKRNADLLKENAISQADCDQAALQVQSVNADIDLIKAQISKTEIMAPYDGVLGLRNISLGAQIIPGTAIATIRSVGKLKLEFSVPEKYGNSVKAGLKVIFALQGEDEHYDATVTATEEAVEASTRNLKAKAVIDNKTSALKPGAFATVDLDLGENKNALMIPTQAIIPQERNKQVIAAKGGKAIFTAIKTGTRQASAVEVVSGLKEGDTIVTTGVLFLKPGADIKFSKISQ